MTPPTARGGLGKPPPRKRFGQHFLESAWVSKLLACIKPSDGDLFLEIGPGAGQLTLPLARVGGRVIAVEIDRDLAGKLRATAPSTVSVVTGDILRHDLQELLAHSAPSQPSPLARVVGNLPYNISTPILGHLIQTQQQAACFVDATLMLQREVADRVVARPGSRNYGPLAILTRVAADARLVLALPPGAFRPPPKVRSAVVSLSFRPSPVPIGDLVIFEYLVRGVFTQRRKTILNALGPVMGKVSHASASGLLARAKIAADRRPATLDLPELARLAYGLSNPEPQP